jgi:dolichyl-phosphate-mannose-protein mannosyltransferase
MAAMSEPTLDGVGQPGPRRVTLLLAVLGAGLLLRVVLAFVVFPGQGYANDMRIFGGWAAALAARGPGAFYTGVAFADYPPGYLYVLWALGSLSGPAGALLGIARGDALVALLKVPAILADVGVAALLSRAAGRQLGARAGLVAAGLYLFIPVTWYDSALWGQVDAVGALAMMAALVLLIEGWSEAAAVAVVLGILVKPQALVCLAVVAPVLLRRHLLAVGSGPVPPLGRRLARLNALLGGLLVRQGPIRLASSALAAAGAAVAVLAPFDIARFAPASLAGVPVAGHVAGLFGLSRSLASEYSVLTANAYNAWALVGPHPLAGGMGAGLSAWTADSLPVLGGVQAVVVGSVLLGAVALVVASGLLLRDGWLAIVLGFTLVAFAFYATPTRVHERYLFPAFASGAILASAAVVRAAGFVAAGIVYTVNLHAVLVPPIAVGAGLRPGAGPGFGPGFGPGLGLRGGPGIGGARPALGPPGIGIGRVADIHLPLADLARSPLAATTVSVAQTCALLALVAAWLVVVARSGGRPLRARM